MALPATNTNESPPGRRRRIYQPVAPGFQPCRGEIGRSVITEFQGNQPERRDESRRGRPRGPRHGHGAATSRPGRAAERDLAKIAFGEAASVL
jgi:hypothetical protein